MVITLKVSPFKEGGICMILNICLFLYLIVRRIAPPMANDVWHTCFLLHALETASIHRSMV